MSTSVANSGRTTQRNAGKGIDLVLGWPKAGGGSQVQSVLFSRDTWDVAKAKKWLKQHGYRSIGLDVTDGKIRARQMEPGQMERFRTKEIGNPSSKDPATMTAGQINTELDKLRKESMKLVQKFIDVGRGHERYSEIVSQSDPLSVAYLQLGQRERKLMAEIEARYGPSHGGRLPVGRGFGPRVKNPTAEWPDWVDPEEKTFLEMVWTKAKKTEQPRLRQISLAALKKLMYSRFISATALHALDSTSLPIWVSPLRSDPNVYSVLKTKAPVGNPGSLAEAEEMSQSFHGREPEEIIDLLEPEKYHQDLTKLGNLRLLEVVLPGDMESGKVVPIQFVEDGEDVVELACTPDGNQLLLLAGDQTLDLNALEVPEELQAKDYIEVGTVHSITYFTDKHHLAGPKYQAKGCEYVHIFGEDKGGIKPDLVYDRLNERMTLTGGTYKVEERGIVN